MSLSLQTAGSSTEPCSGQGTQHARRQERRPLSRRPQLRTPFLVRWSWPMRILAGFCARTAGSPRFRFVARGAERPKKALNEVVRHRQSARYDCSWTRPFQNTVGCKMPRKSKSSRRQISIIEGACSRFGAWRDHIGAAFSDHPGRGSAVESTCPQVSRFLMCKLLVPERALFMYLI